MKARTDLIASLADDLLHGVRKRDHMPAILNGRRLLDECDELLLIRGGSEAWLDVTERAEKLASSYVMAWLETPAGRDLIAEEVEREAEDERDEQEAA